MTLLDSTRSRATATPESVAAGGGAGRERKEGPLVDGEFTIGRYVIERPLGRGAAGVVYLARDPATGGEVAVKTAALAHEFAAEEFNEARERFLREAQAAGRMDHPYIVRIFESGEENGLAYMAMEYVRGTDLMLHAGPEKLLPLESVLSIMARVADALAYAHRHGIVHRDIKPANILYERESDTVKLADFGMARLTNLSRTRTGVVFGTPSYMSPEQLTGRDVGPRSDLFSLGAALYQLAAGRLPFEGDTLAQIMFRIANEPHPDIRRHNGGLPACVAAIVNRALAKRPDERYQNAGQMAKALRLCLRNLRGSARRRPPASC